MNYIGVSPTQSGKFLATVTTPDGESIVGIFDTDHQAALEHDKAAFDLVESPNLNFPWMFNQ